MHNKKSVSPLFYLFKIQTTHVELNYDTDDKLKTDGAELCGGYELQEKHFGQRWYSRWFVDQNAGKFCDQTGHGHQQAGSNQRSYHFAAVAREKQGPTDPLKGSRDN